MVLSLHCDGSILQKSHCLAYLSQCQCKTGYYCIPEGLPKTKRPLWPYVSLPPGNPVHCLCIPAASGFSYVVQSFSKKGYPFDNACCECFFKYLKKEETDRKCYRSLQELQLSIFEYIEGYYNSKRPHGTLNMLTPNEAEDLYWEMNA